MPMLVIPVILLAILIWYLLAKFFVKIGTIAEKTAKPFTENLKNEGEDKNE